MAAEASIDVSLRDGHSWRSQYVCRALGPLMAQLLVHNFRAISTQTLHALGLDPATRRMKGNQLLRDNGKRDSVVSIKEYRTVNKALSMELVVAALFTHLDSPQEVRSPCVLSDESEPKSFAPAEHADILVFYANGMRILIEVSAKRDVSPEFLHRQFTQGFAHAEDEWESDPTGPIYVLVINGGSLEGNPKLRKVYEAADQIPREGDIRLLPLNGLELAQVARDLADQPDGTGLDFDSHTLAAALDLVRDRTRSGGDGDEPGWMGNALCEALQAGPMDLANGHANAGPKQRNPGTSAPSP